MRSSCAWADVERRTVIVVGNAAECDQSNIEMNDSAPSAKAPTEPVATSTDNTSRSSPNGISHFFCPASQYYLTMADEPISNDDTHTPSTDPTADNDDGDGAESSSDEGGGLWALIQQLGPASVMAVVWAAAPAILGIYLLTRIDDVSEYLQGLGNAGLALYIGVFVVSAGFGLLPTYAQAILGGWVFGIAAGIPAALAGFTGASLIGYGITRFIARDRVEDCIDDHPRAQIIRDALIGNRFWKTLGIISLVRVPPNSPFALTNLVLASSGARVLPYTLGTLLGMTPRTAVAIVFAAAAAKQADGGGISAFLDQGSNRWVLVIGIVVFVAVLMVISKIANSALDRVMISGKAAGATGVADSG